MPYKATLVYTEALLRQAVWGFWRRTVGVGFVVAWVISALCWGVLMAQGYATWLLGALAAVLVMAVVLVAALYGVHYRNTMRTFKAMGNAPATFCADESSFTTSSTIGSATLQWSAVRELWRFQDVWLLVYGKSQFSTLPLTCMSAPMQAFVVQRIELAGGKVLG